MSCFSDDTILMVIADGLGGEPAGEIASNYVIEEFKQLTSMDYMRIFKDPPSFFRKMDHALCTLAEKNHELNGMATTLISIFIKNHVAYWCHSGDSRLYHLRKNRIRQITQDQNLARFLIQEGELTKQQAKHHYSKNVIDQCIGCKDLTPESGKILLEPGDVLILTSDGLYRSIAEQDICRTISRFSKPELAVDALIKLSLEAGGKDNSTVVIGKIH
jgi:protein phosphatase